MSLHNSTNLENQDWTFLKLVELKSKRRKFVLLKTNQKPSEAGFDLRGEATKQLSINACVNASFAQ